MIQISQHGYAHRQVVLRGLVGNLAVHKSSPRLVALVNDLSSVLLVLRLTRERELVLRLTIGDLVDPEVAS